MLILWPVRIFCLFCGQRLFYAQLHSDDGHAANNVETDPAPSDEELDRIFTFLSRLFHLLLLP